MVKFFSSLVTLVTLSLFAVGCGSNGGGTLNGVQVSTSTNANNEVLLSFSANLNLGALSFASISLPIINPKTHMQVGQVDLVSGIGGQNVIKVTANLTELASIQTAQAVLPNGNMIPLIANNQAIAVNLGNGARLYLAVSANVTAIGVAVPISAFDHIGATLPGLNFFPVVNMNNVVATAGIFTGMNAGQNGIAVVADVSNIIKLGNVAPTQTLALMERSTSSVSADMKLDFRSHAPSKAAQSKLAEAMMKLNQKRIKLSIK